MKNNSALFYTCSLIEYIGRMQRLPRAAVVQGLKRETIARIYDYADVFHCEPIAKAELVYHNSTGDTYYMPYYRFYVALLQQDNATTNLQTYGAYYVPAIAGEYLTNMPSWDGAFNEPQNRAV